MANDDWNVVPQKLKLELLKHENNIFGQLINFMITASGAEYLFAQC